MNILICTLGGSWAVIPEVYGFLAPEILPLYAYHPQRADIKKLKEDYKLSAPDEVWVCTTQGVQTENSLVQLKRWILTIQNPPVLRIWQAKGTDQLATQAECDHIKELIVRACLKAHQTVNEAKAGQVILSLAGGRKTMSADMQWAGSLFGCAALLHVIGSDSLPDELRKPEPTLLSKALPEVYAGCIMPLVAGKTTRSDLLDIFVDGVKPIFGSTDYPLELPAVNQVFLFDHSSLSLTTELIKREKASSRLFGNYLLQISQDEKHENWRSLYRLPPRLIDQLRQTYLKDVHLDWLIKLPKADLHRHLGGCLDLSAQRQVAIAIWDSLTDDEQLHAKQNIQFLLGLEEWPWDWPEKLKQGGDRSHNSAALLVYASDQQLCYNLWDVNEPRLALRNNERGFSAYERPGELTGSALLTHPASIKPYVHALIKQTLLEGLVYVELRGSPQKYGDGLTFIKQFNEALKFELASLPETYRPQFRFIIIADRRADVLTLKKTIKLAVDAKCALPDFVVGLDMAGDEQQTKPKDIAHLFTPAFEYCLPITIHAGEGEKAESIWQAAYHLHADRIGHGLTLNDNDNLAQRFRDRNICLELCPTSNREVVGYKDVRYPESFIYPSYPLIALWRKGLPLTLCTDNPGISRTTLAEEYLTAAAMSDYQLTLWDVLGIIKQSFVHCFLSGDEKEKLLKVVDAHLYQLISEEISLSI